MRRDILAFFCTAIVITLIISLIVWLCSPATNKAEVDCLTEMEAMNSKEKAVFEKARDGECEPLQEYFVVVARFEDRYATLLEIACSEEEKKVARLNLLTAKEKQARTLAFALHHKCCWALKSLVDALESETADGEVPDRKAAIWYYRTQLEENCETEDKIEPDVPRNQDILLTAV